MRYLIASFQRWVGISCVMSGTPTCPFTPSFAAINPRVVHRGAVDHPAHRVPLDRRALAARLARRVQVAPRDRAVAGVLVPDLEVVLDPADQDHPPGKAEALDPAGTPGRAATRAAADRRDQAAAREAPVQVVVPVHQALVGHLAVPEVPAARVPRVPVDLLGLLAFQVELVPPDQVDRDQNHQAYRAVPDLVATPDLQVVQDQVVLQAHQALAALVPLIRVDRRAPPDPLDRAARQDQVVPAEPGARVVRVAPPDRNPRDRADRVLNLVRKAVVSHRGLAHRCQALVVRFPAPESNHRGSRAAEQVLSDLDPVLQDRVAREAQEVPVVRAHPGNHPVRAVLDPAARVHQAIAVARATTFGMDSGGIP